MLASQAHPAKTSSLLSRLYSAAVLLNLPLSFWDGSGRDWGWMCVQARYVALFLFFTRQQVKYYCCACGDDEQVVVAAADYMTLVPAMNTYFFLFLSLTSRVSHPSTPWSFCFSHPSIVAPPAALLTSCLAAGFSVVFVEIQKLYDRFETGNRPVNL